MATVDLGPRQARRTLVTAAANIGRGDIVPVVLAGGTIADGTEIGEVDFPELGRRECSVQPRNLGFLLMDQAFCACPTISNPGGRRSLCSGIG